MFRFNRGDNGFSVIIGNDKRGPLRHVSFGVNWKVKGAYVAIIDKSAGTRAEDQMRFCGITDGRRVALGRLQ